MKKIALFLSLISVFHFAQAYKLPEQSAYYKLKQYKMKEAMKSPDQVQSILIFGDDESLKLFRQHYEEFKNLTVLQIIGDDCASLDSIFPKLTTVKFLRLNRCELFSLPSSIPKMKQLTFVNFSGNNLNEFPYELAELPQLQEINLGDGIYGGNPFTLLDERIGKFTQIKSLCMYQCKVDSISPALCELTQLEYFNLMQGNLRELPADFGKLTQLQEVLINRNDLKAYPTQLNSLPGLRVLYITLPDLEMDYSELSIFTDLEELSISVKGQKTLPPSFLSMQKLQGLYLAFSGELNAKKLVADLKTLPKLRKVNLYSNGFSDKQKAYIRKQIPHVKFNLW